MILIIILIAIAAFAIYVAVKRQKIKSRSLEYIAQNGFTFDYKLDLPNGYVAIDRKLEKIALFNINSKVPAMLLFSDITDYEIIKDNVTVFKKSGSVGNAVIGGLLFGGVGAIVGSATSKSTGQEKTKKAVLKINTNNFDNPSHTLVIFDGTTPSFLQKKLLDNAQNLCDRLSIILDNNKEREI